MQEKTSLEKEKNGKIITFLILTLGTLQAGVTCQQQMLGIQEIEDLFL